MSRSTRTGRSVAPSELHPLDQVGLVKGAQELHDFWFGMKRDELVDVFDCRWPQAQPLGLDQHVNEFDADWSPEQRP
ncbi:MAG: hypothetical protein ACR2L9_08770 [Solirubrobacteraceae bacterium]